MADTASSAIDAPPTSAEAGARAERRLVTRARSGSGEALAELLSAHWPAAYRTALLVGGDPVAAEDIAQEAMIAAIKGFRRFDPRRRFGPWLHRIAANRAIDHARAQSRAAPATDADPNCSAEPAAATNLGPELAAALSGLEPKDRAIVVMRHLQGHTSEEIGKALGLPAGTVRRRLAESMGALRAVLPRKEER